LQEMILPGVLTLIAPISVWYIFGTNALGGFLVGSTVVGVLLSLMMANSVGIIDAGYRGNIMAKVRNMSQTETTINEGEKLFQICSPTLEPIKFQIVDKLSDSSRGAGGFGSTGK